MTAGVMDSLLIGALAAVVAWALLSGLGIGPQIAGTVLTFSMAARINAALQP